MLRILITTLSLLTLMMVSLVPASALERPMNSASQAAKTEQGSGIGIRLLDIPSATQTDPRARSYIVDHLNPGSRIERRVQVLNSSAAPQTIHIYSGAASVVDGSFVGSEGATENQLTSWITVDQPQVILAPGVSANILVEIDVPSDAPEAEQYAAVWAEVRSAPDPGGGIVNASRVGVRVYLSVGPGNGPPADFSIDSLTPSRTPDDAPEITTTVTNTGGRALDIGGTLTLEDGPGGLSAGPNPIDKGITIAPGDRASVTVSLDPELPNGPWSAELMLKSGLVEKSAKATITFPESGEGKAVEVDDPAFPLVPVGVALMMLVAAVIWWTLRRRKIARSRQI